MEPGDVSVKRLGPRRCGCGKHATHAVWVDFRAIGLQRIVDEACETCARDAANRLRGSLRELG